MFDIFVSMIEFNLYYNGDNGVVLFVVNYLIYISHELNFERVLNNSIIYLNNYG